MSEIYEKLFLGGLVLKILLCCLLYVVTFCAAYIYKHVLLQVFSDHDIRLFCWSLHNSYHGPRRENKMHFTGKTSPAALIQHPPIEMQ